jgi:hypothetical protein
LGWNGGPLKKTATKAAGQDNLEKARSDFRVFLFLTWEALGLPVPTPIQYDVARFLQHGPKRVSIQAFRGAGKSFVTAAFAVWVLLNDPQKKILLVSASKSRADAIATFIMALIYQMPMLAHLIPKANQRQSKLEFDVGPATADQSPSVKSAGINGQITGSRADLIISDDIEVPSNSATMDQREKLAEKVKEFAAILKPLPDSRIIYLGTPQTEESIYSKLDERGFQTRVWPAEVPDRGQIDSYGSKLAPMIAKMAETMTPGSPTEPVRFSTEDLAERRAEYGRAGYSLQFMLSTALSDQERYPLKLRDLIVAETTAERAPMSYEWLPDPRREWSKLPNMGMGGDRYFQPASYSETFSDYSGSVMAIDPSGRGADETSYAVVKMLNGFLTVRKCGGFPGGYDDETLRKLGDIARAERVNHVVVESNFGDGMFTELLRPVLTKIWPCFLEEIRHSGVSKERRIIDVLEPVMARHKLVFDRKVIEDDYETARAYSGDNVFTKCLMYQLTRISYAKGALKHDDRLDALAMGVGYWTEKMGVDHARGIQKLRDDAFDKELRDFSEGVLGFKNRSGTRWMNIRGR